MKASPVCNCSDWSRLGSCAWSSRSGCRVSPRLRRQIRARGSDGTPHTPSQSSRTGRTPHTVFGTTRTEWVRVPNGPLHLANFCNRYCRSQSHQSQFRCPALFLRTVLLNHTYRKSDIWSCCRLIDWVHACEQCRQASPCSSRPPSRRSSQGSCSHRGDIHVPGACGSHLRNSIVHSPSQSSFRARELYYCRHSAECFH